MPITRLPPTTRYNEESFSTFCLRLPVKVKDGLKLAAIIEDTTVTQLLLDASVEIIKRAKIRYS